MKIKCIIVDDEFPARALLQDFISKIPNLELIGSYKSPVEAIQIIQKGQIDLMFLDIQMPDITGIDFIKSLNKKPLTIFTTAYMEYAIEGYQLDVLDYLLKPFAFDRFVMAINKVIERIGLKDDTPPSLNEGLLTDSISNKNFIVLKADHKIHRVKFDQILYIEGLREYVTFFCKKEKIITLESLRNLENILPENSFLRIHKSYIVNMDGIKSLYGNQLILEGTDKIIPIGKSYRDEVQKRVFKN